MECRTGSRDYDLIKARLEQEMGNSTTVLKVKMNANVDLLRRYHLERKKVADENGGDANEVWLWHATSSNGAEKSIFKNGNRCGLDFEYYGAGTYLAPDCKLSNRYAAKSETLSMLLVRVACGKIFERSPLHHSPERERERLGERERALLGTMVHNGGSRSAPSNGLRITTRFPASVLTLGGVASYAVMMMAKTFPGL